MLLLSTTHTLMGVGLCGTQTPEYGTHTYVSEGLTGFWLCESLDSLPPVSRWITVSRRFFENETTKTGIHLSDKGPRGMFL